MQRKTGLLVFVFMTLMCTVLAAQTGDEKINSLNFDAGLYGQFRLSLGTLDDYHFGLAGGGAEVYCTLPFSLPEHNIFSALGVSARIGAEVPIEKTALIESWSGMDIQVGFWADVKLMEWFYLRPEISIGPIFNRVKAPIRGVDGIYVDTLLTTGLSTVFKPKIAGKRDLSFRSGFNYSFLMEKDDTGLYLEFQLGALYRLPFKSGEKK